MRCNQDFYQAWNPSVLNSPLRRFAPTLCEGHSLSSVGAEEAARIRALSATRRSGGPFRLHDRHGNAWNRNHRAKEWLCTVFLIYFSPGMWLRSKGLPEETNGNVQFMSNNCSVGFRCGLLAATRVPQVVVKTEVG